MNFAAATETPENEPVHAAIAGGPEARGRTCVSVFHLRSLASIYLGRTRRTTSSHPLVILAESELSQQVKYSGDRIRGHPYMTSAKFWDFLTPPVRIWD